MNNIYNFDKAEWTISGAFAYDKYLIPFIDIVQKYERCQIKSVFGCPSELIWNGGRQISKQYSTIAEIKELIEKYNQRGIAVNLTANYFNIKEIELKNKFANEVLKLLVSLGQKYSIKNGIILSSDKLLQYIKKSYPDLLIIASIVRASANRKQSYDDKYFDTIVLHPDDNFNYKLISELDKNKLEICVNEQCILNCPVRLMHYEKTNLFNNNSISYKELNNFENKKCVSGSQVFNIKGARPCSYTSTELDKIYKLGVYKFKIQGRRDSNYTFLSQLFDMCIYMFNNDFFSSVIYKKMVVNVINEL